MEIARVVESAKDIVDSRSVHEQSFALETVTHSEPREIARVDSHSGHEPSFDPEETVMQTDSTETVKAVLIAKDAADSHPAAEVVAPDPAKNTALPRPTVVDTYTRFPVPPVHPVP